MQRTVRKYTNRITSFLTAIIMVLVSVSFPIGKSSAINFEDNELKEKANQLALLINEARKENDLPPVYVLPYLNDKARERSREAIAAFSHTRPNGEAFSSIIDTNMVNYRVTAENIAAGSETAKETLKQWKNSSSHWKAILNPKMTHIGVGCSYEQNSPYLWYWDLILVNTADEYREQYIPTEYAIVPKGKGDVNGDGVLDVYDYVMVVDYVTKSTANRKAMSPNATEEEKDKYYPVYLNDAQWEAAECYINDGELEGSISVYDARAIMKYILGEIKTLPYINAF